MASPEIPEGHVPYGQVVRDNEDNLDTPPRTANLVNAARKAVRRVCQDLNVLQQRQWFDLAESKQYVLEHSGWTFCQPFEIHLDKETDECLLGARHYRDTQMGPDTSTWTFAEQESFSFKQVLVKFSVKPTMLSRSFPMIVYEQYDQLVGLAFLALMAPYVHKRDKRSGSNTDYHAEYMNEMRNQKARTEKPWTSEPTMHTAEEYY